MPMDFTGTGRSDEALDSDEQLCLGGKVYYTVLCLLIARGPRKRSVHSDGVGSGQPRVSHAHFQSQQMELILNPRPTRLGTALGLCAPSIPSGVSSGTPVSAAAAAPGEFSPASVPDADGASVN